MKCLVPKVGLEPTRYCYRGILNPLRLPFRHLGRATGYLKARAKVQSEKHAIFHRLGTAMVDHGGGAWFGDVSKTSSARTGHPC